MHCMSLAIISRLSRCPSPAVGTNWPFCVDVPLNNQPTNLVRGCVINAVLKVRIGYYDQCVYTFYRMCVIQLYVARRRLFILWVCVHSTAVRWLVLYLADSFSLNISCITLAPSPKPSEITHTCGLVMAWCYRVTLLSCNVRYMHCISLAILSRLSRFPSPAVGTSWRAIKQRNNSIY